MITIPISNRDVVTMQFLREFFHQVTFKTPLPWYMENNSDYVDGSEYELWPSIGNLISLLDGESIHPLEKVTFKDSVKVRTRDRYQFFELRSVGVTGVLTIHVDDMFQYLWRLIPAISPVWLKKDVVVRQDGEDLRFKLGVYIAMLMHNYCGDIASHDMILDEAKEKC